MRQHESRAFLPWHCRRVGPLNGQQIEKVECKALNVKAPMNGLSAFDILLYVPLSGAVVVTVGASLSALAYRWRMRFIAKRRRIGNQCPTR
jgi:hypothetical protein